VKPLLLCSRRRGRRTRARRAACSQNVRLTDCSRYAAGGGSFYLPRDGRRRTVGRRRPRNSSCPRDGTQTWLAIAIRLACPISGRIRRTITRCFDVAGIRRLAGRPGRNGGRPDPRRKAGRDLAAHGVRPSRACGRGSIDLIAAAIMRSMTISQAASTASAFNAVLAVLCWKEDAIRGVRHPRCQAYDALISSITCA